ncbi:MAG: DnaD domain protein [Anaeroplasma sp.]|nr:DnaD domain protein [Anaeroplasma sp.]
MAVKSIDSTKKFNIYSNFTLSNDDVSVVSLLYTPLMGSDALMLYLGFQSLLERNNLKSEEIVHQDLFDIFSLTPASFLKARYKLEGIGLLITYEKNDGNFIYFLCPPLTAKNFIKDATLGLFLYSKIRKETFDYIYNHFKLEKFEKETANNITKSFDEVYSSEISNDSSYEKFGYILGKKPNKNIKIKDYGFDFDKFSKEINLDFLETGITQTFQNQICNLAFVYGFDEMDMAGLYSESINKRGLYDYRLLKNKANILFMYKKNMKAPKLVTKEEANVVASDLISYLENTSPKDILEDIVPDYPESYLITINDIYSNIDLKRGVLNCMIIKVIKDKGGELPNLSYFKKVSESWIKDNVFTTEDAIKYVTLVKYTDSKPSSKTNVSDGWIEL